MFKSAMEAIRVFHQLFDVSVNSVNGKTLYISHEQMDDALCELQSNMRYTSPPSKGMQELRYQFDFETAIKIEPKITR